MATVALVGAGCDSGDPAASTTAGDAIAARAEDATPVLPVAVVDAGGRTVDVEDVSRIVPLAGNIAEVVFALGLGDRVVARDVSTTFEEAEHLPLVTRAHDVSAESVLSVRPTLVLADEDTGPPEALDQIRGVGIPVVVFEHPTSVEEVTTHIEAIAAALGVPAAGTRVAADTQAAIDDVRASIPDGDAPVVAFLYLRGQASVYLLGGPGSGTDSMIAAAGGIDAGTRSGLHNPFTPMTSEAMVAAAPDVIMLTTTGLESVGGIDGLVGIPGIAQTPAGRDRRVIAVEDGLLFGFGSRTPEALATIIDQLYP
jgi:iron complex transport system substrate-binding protein